MLNDSQRIKAEKLADLKRLDRDYNLYMDRLRKHIEILHNGGKPEDCPGLKRPRTPKVTKNASEKEETVPQCAAQLIVDDLFESVGHARMLQALVTDEKLSEDEQARLTTVAFLRKHYDLKK